MTSDLPSSTLFGWLERLLSRAEGVLFGPANLRNYAMFGTVLAITILIEVVARNNWRMRYGSRNFRIDVLYYVFYYSGVYQFLVWAWMYKALSQAFTTYLPWLQLNVIGGLSQTMQVVALIVVFDFFHYWNHRLRHAIPWLWAFHSIHHSQTTMTMMTTFRFHIVDETVFRILMFIPFHVLGFSPLLTIWLWADLVTAWITGAQHANLTWSYGRFGQLFVSPYFHRIHHSNDERLANRNYGGVFSCWDDLFRTAERHAPCPTEHGLAGNPVPETMLGHLVYPFVMIWRNLRKDAKNTVPITPAAPPQEQASAR